MAEGLATRQQDPPMCAGEPLSVYGLRTKDNCSDGWGTYIFGQSEMRLSVSMILPIDGKFSPESCFATYSSLDIFTAYDQFFLWDRSQYH